MTTELELGLDCAVRRAVSHMPTLGLYLRVSIHDAQGRIVRRGRWQRSHSYLKQVIQILRAHINLVDEAGVLDTSNASKTVEGNTPANYVLLAVAPAATSTYGPVVGTGSTAVVITDYALGTQIAHGTGAGQMEYGASTTSSVVVLSSTASFTLSRVFTNSSGASITVNEVGVYAAAQPSAGGAAYFCIVRDVATGGLPATVAHTQTVTIEYTIKATA